jgi:hypothetical protein
MNGKVESPSRLREGLGVGQCAPADTPTPDPSPTRVGGLR